MVAFDVPMQYIKQWSTKLKFERLQRPEPCQLLSGFFLNKSKIKYLCLGLAWAER